MTETLQPGAELAGYRIDSLVGRGGMGSVYLAEHRGLRRKVALKVLAPELAADRGFRERFVRESQLAASLEHPNLVPIYDAAEAGGVLFIAMRYIAGSDLKATLEREGRLSEERVASVISAVAAALDAAHAAGLIHRDVKPANVLIGTDGHVYLTDFGIAKAASGAALTKTGSFVGTVDYCSPEQIEGRPLSAAADEYALACLAFECLTGRTPFARDSEAAMMHAHLVDPPPSARALRPELRAALDAVLARGLAKDPRERFASAGAFAEALRGELTPAANREGAAPTAPRRASPTLRSTAVTRVRRPRRLFLALGAVAAAALAGIVVFLFARGGGREGLTLRGFVGRVESMLVQSAAGRREINAALGGPCTRAAAARLQSVADNRQSILDQLSSLRAPTDAAGLAADQLALGLTHSIEVDRHYRDWLRARCPREGADLAAARREDPQASAAKRRFVAAFNPLARRFGRRIWSAGEI